MKHYRFFLLIIINLLPTFFLVAQTSKTKPNVLFIAIDDMNDWVSPLKGITGVKTPNLERLSKSSMLFTNAQCAAPACAPSRLSIMTGVHPAHSGIMNNSPDDGPFWRSNPILKNVVTMEQFFKSKGYHTLAGGKIYHSLAPPWKQINQADPDGWDFWFPSYDVPIPYQVRAPEKDIYHPEWKGVLSNRYFTWAPLKVKDEKMADNQTVDWAVYEMNQKQEKPLFLAVGLFKPHMPWEVPQKYFDMYPLESIPDLKIKENDLEDAFDHGRRLWHKYVLQNKQWKKVIQAYMACLSFADNELGRLLDGFEKSPLKDNTIIVLWSDHGMHMGEKENWEKFTLWEESTRVPLMVKAPGVTKGGSICSTPVSLIDIYPTLAELIGETPPATCDGESLVPLLSGKKVLHTTPVTAYNFKRGSRTAYYKMDTGPGYAVRTERYRYIYYPSNGLEEFYDHQNDENEWNNMAYMPSFKNLILEHRNILLKRVPGLTWSRETPKGYKIFPDGTIKKIGFIPLANLPYPKEELPENRR